MQIFKTVLFEWWIVKVCVKANNRKSFKLLLRALKRLRICCFQHETLDCFFTLNKINVGVNFAIKHGDKKLSRQMFPWELEISDLLGRKTQRTHAKVNNVQKPRITYSN